MFIYITTYNQKENPIIRLDGIIIGIIKMKGYPFRGLWVIYLKG